MEPMNQVLYFSKAHFMSFHAIYHFLQKVDEQKNTEYLPYITSNHVTFQTALLFLLNVAIKNPGRFGCCERGSDLDCGKSGSFSGDEHVWIIYLRERWTMATWTRENIGMNIPVGLFEVVNT